MSQFSKKSIFILIFIHLFFFFSYSQTYKKEKDSLLLMYDLGIYKPLSVQDSVSLSNLPLFQPSPAYLATVPSELPAIMDNSTEPYHRPVFQQGGYSCGQAALVGYNFTYEENFVRNLSGDNPANQYPTHFAWNWMNAGNNYGGVSFYHTMEVLRAAGTPNVEDYGGMSAGGETRWMTGYDEYYKAMQNRIENAYNIRTDTYDGFMTLKYWLYDHANGSETGGVASFYANQPATYLLPAGTPEAGKHVCIGWASYSSHALTIVGWNDSIRWDYNNDGTYTNHVDINGDGTVNMKDWEIGGFKFVNSYGGIPGWADSGYCYMMYKTVAEKFGEGGIWNNTVNILKAKKNCSPQITFKASVTHANRSRIKIIAGIAADTTASEPEVLMDFPIFDYQGGNYYMQGGSSEEDKTIEFGLDITPLLNYIEPGQEARYFFILNEYDPGNSYNGSVNYVSLIDYSNGENELPFADSNMVIVSNGETMLSIVSDIDYEDITITTTSLPEAVLYQPYEYQLLCSGGSSPYFWNFDMQYDETDQSQAFPSVNQETLTPTDNTDGYAFKKIDFPFPFYGKVYDTVYMYVDGFLKFDNFLVTWPYHQDKYIRWTKNKNIAPFFDVDLRIYTNQGDGIWYEGDSSSATFRWKVSQSGHATTSHLNLAVTLYPSGNIEYYYNDMLLVGSPDWYAGISNGDGKFLHQTGISGSSSFSDNHKITLAPVTSPTEFSLSDNGILTGIPEKEYNNHEISVQVTDANNVSSSSTLLFNTTGIMSTFIVEAGEDDIIERADTVYLDVVLKNISQSAINNAEMTLTCQDPYISMTDTTENVGTINPDETKTFDNAFSFYVSDSVQNNHELPMIHKIFTPADTFTRNITFTAYTSLLSIQDITVDDGSNNRLDPGETTDILVEIKNSGGGKATGMESFLSSLDPHITVNSGYDTISSLPGNTTQDLTFNITVSAIAPQAHIAYFDIDIYTAQNISVNDSIFLPVGSILEDFETGDFSKYPWYFTGHEDWLIDDINAYEGNYSAVSGIIGHSKRSTLHLEGNVLSNSKISFYRRVSSEQNYDFLIFTVSESERGRWSGEQYWDKQTYDVKRGFKEFKWEYRKDASVSNGSDRAWIDYVELPPLKSMLLKVYAGTDDTICEDNTCQLYGEIYNADSIRWFTTGSGTFSNDTLLNPVYTPGESDIITGSVVIGLTGYHSKGEELTDYKTIFITRSPIALAGEDTTICENSNLPLNGMIIHSDSAYWSTTGDGIFADTASLITTYYPGQQDINNGSTAIMLTAFPRTPCTGTDTDTLFVNFQFLPVVFAGEDDSICETSSCQLSGQIENASSPGWITTGDGFFDDPSSLTAIYTPGENDIENGFVDLILSASALYPCEGISYDTVGITILNSLNTDAGEDQSIEYSTSTTLSGSCSGGSGDYSYSWTPEAFLLDHQIQNPTTVPLTSSVIFTLSTLDNITGCTGEDHVTVNVIGSPFLIEISADPYEICMGDSTQLSVVVEGSTGPYTFSWTSDPPGFNSDEQNPVDSPEVTTTYYVTVTDAIENEVQGFTVVEVFEPPVPWAGNDTTVCANQQCALQGEVSNCDSVNWETSGDGTFSINNQLTTLYAPGQQDIITGEVTISLVAYGSAPCNEPVSDDLLLSVLPVPEVTLPPFPMVCIDDPPFPLTEGQPLGGSYFGTGVIDGFFYPSVAGLGDHTISYTYTSENDCTDTAQQIITVDPCTGMDEYQSITDMTVIPNPNDGTFTLNISSGIYFSADIEIVTLTGVSLWSERYNILKGTNNLKINSSLSPGAYILILKNETSWLIKKLVIHR